MAAKYHRVKTLLLALGITLVGLVLAFCVYIFIESNPFSHYTVEYDVEYHTTVRGGNNENAV